MSPSFDSPPKQEHPRPTPEGAGAMAKRAEMLFNAWQGAGSERRGLCVLADSDVATILRDHYPHVDSIDANVEILGGQLQEKVRQALQGQDRANESWVIIATKTGVYVYEVATGKFLPNDATVWLRKNLERGPDAFVDRAHQYAKRVHPNTSPIDPPSGPAL